MAWVFSYKLAACDIPMTFYHLHASFYLFTNGILIINDHLLIGFFKYVKNILLTEMFFFVL